MELQNRYTDNLIYAINLARIICKIYLQRAAKVVEDGGLQCKFFTTFCRVRQR